MAILAFGGIENMEKEIEELFNDEVLAEARKRFGLYGLVLNLGAYQNLVYEYEIERQPYILRFTHSHHRQENQVKGELQWVLYLYNNGASVSKPIHSIYGNLTERINVGSSYFTVTSFEKAKGRKVAYPECLNNDELTEMCGRVTGKIHALSKKYSPESYKFLRHEWKENYYLKNMSKFIPDNEYKIYENYETLVKRINSFTKDTDSYGLIHGDISVGNFLLGDKGITVFDFDECQYSWFVEDIAIQLFYIVYVFLDDSIEERQKQAYYFIEHFMKGYNEENHLDDKWINEIPTFLQLRELIVYIGMCRDLDFSSLNQWQKNYVSQSKSRLERGVPIVNKVKK